MMKRLESYYKDRDVVVLEVLQFAQSSILLSLWAQGEEYSLYRTNPSDECIVDYARGQEISYWFPPVGIIIQVPEMIVLDNACIFSRDGLEGTHDLILECVERASTMMACRERPLEVFYTSYSLDNK